MYFTAVSTYLSCLLLICFGHLRDFLDRILQFRLTNHDLRVNFSLVTSLIFLSIFLNKIFFLQVILFVLSNSGHNHKKSRIVMNWDMGKIIWKVIKWLLLISFVAIFFCWIYYYLHLDLQEAPGVEFNKVFDLSWILYVCWVIRTIL